MSAVHGRLGSVLINQFDLSRQLKTFNAQNAAPEIECTGFQASGREYIANFREGSLGLEGFFQQDPTLLNGTDDVFQDLKDDASPAVVTISPEGATQGKRALLCNAVETRANVDTPADGYVAAMADFRGQIDGGVVLQALGTVTADGNGTAHDNAAASTNGGVAHLHVTAFGDDTDTLDVKIQHSVDNSVWADKVLFTQRTAVGAERVTISGTINRYTRAVRAVEGSSPSVTFAVALARL